MKLTLIERLPGDRALYQINCDETILPGQWLSADNNRFPVFQCADRKIQFVSPERPTLSEKFVISGEPIILPDNDNQLLLLADEEAIPLLFFLIHHLRHQWGEKKLADRVYQILLGTESFFPFTPVPSNFLMPDIPTGIIASSQLLEDFGLPARLASANELPGCFSGSLSTMLNQLNFDTYLQNKTSVIAIGSRDLLDTTKKLFDRRATKQFLIKY